MTAYERVLQELKEVAYLRGVEALLSWDQETYMPSGAGGARSEQIAYISGLMHDKLVSESMRSALGELVDLESGEILNDDHEDLERIRLQEIWRDYHQAVALPGEFVQDLAKHASVAQQAWVKARQGNDFSLFEPFLAKMVELQKRKAGYLGIGETAYDSLMDEYEPGMSSAEMQTLFDELRERLVPLVRNIQEVKHRVNNSVLKRDYDIQKQWDFGMDMLKAIGFDLNYGRQDRSAHPFTTNTHMHDVRTTTRLRENDLRSALLSTLHEGGHGLYEQGFLPQEFGNPFGEAISLGIHESQSRLWENLVGLSVEFWDYAYPRLRNVFPEQLKETDKETFYRAMNRVQPSLIRVEADEATYNLHIMLRFEIEKLLINEDLPVKDLPALWNEKMKDYVGILPETDADGVMQDVHWSVGALGYFPTYTLGNLYSVQFYNQAVKDLPEMREQISHGDFAGLLDWLRKNIHIKGRSRKASELVLEVTGSELSARPFMDYLEEKYSNIYGLN